MMYEQYEIPKPLIYAIFALAILSCLLAIVLVILLGALGFYGFDNNSTVIGGSCLNWTLQFIFYFDVKGTFINVALRTSFLTSIISAVSALILVILLVMLVMKLCKEEVISFRGATKVGLYITSSLTVLMAVPTAGSFMVFKIQLATCLYVTYNESHVLAVAVIAMILVGLSLIVWILLLCAYSKESDVQEKYREVISQPTEPNENAKRSEYYQRQKVEERKQRPHEETREQLYQPVEKKPTNYVYSKDPHNSQQEPKNITKYQSRSKLYEKREDNSPTKENPVYQSRQYQQPYNSRGNQKQSNLRYTPERGFTKEQNQSDLVFHKKRRSPETSKQDEALAKESKQYLSRQGGRSILNSENIEEREGKGSDYFRSGQVLGRSRSPPSKKPEREGMLLNYIRGKYAG